MAHKLNMAALTRPISDSEVEWRVAQVGSKRSGEPWAKIVPYVQSRAVMARMDEAFGPLGWTTDFETVEHDGKLNFLCTLSAALPDEDGIISSYPSVHKQDGAPATDIESFKGGISDSLKRAGVQWGIGRELYTIRGAVWAIFNQNGQHQTKIDGKWYSWDAPPLESVLGENAKPQNEATHPRHGGEGDSHLLTPDESAGVASKLIDTINSMTTTEGLTQWLETAKASFQGKLQPDDAARVNGALKDKREELS